MGLMTRGYLLDTNIAIAILNDEVVNIFRQESYLRQKDVSMSLLILQNLLEQSVKIRSRKAEN
jgi:hypothetical protein